MFGAQQAVEGALWFVLPTDPSGPKAAGLVMAFLLLAQVFWPVYTPVATACMKPDPRRRRLMRVCFGLGGVVASYLLWGLLTGPHDAIIVNRCIVYRTQDAHPILIGLAYPAVTGLPLILSSRRAIFALGVIVLLGSAVAYVAYWEAFQSVWCFFAAAGSAVILGHFEWSRRRAQSIALALEAL